MKKLFTIFISALFGGFIGSYAQSTHSVQLIQQNIDVLLNTNHQSGWLSTNQTQTIFTVPLKKAKTQLKAKSLIQINDSIYKWPWDTIANGWDIDPNYKTINIVYDANNNVTSSIQQIWTGSAWENYMYNILTYDASNNVTSNTYQYWIGSAWVNGWLYTFTFDTNNNETSSLSQEWITGAWVNDYQSISTYDTNNNCINRLGQSWNNIAWVNAWQIIYTYDINNNMTNTLSQSWVGSAWENVWQYTSITYDLNNNLLSELFQQWTGGAWVDYRQSTYTYDINNNLTGGLDLRWIGGVWVNSSKFVDTYDVNNNMTNRLGQNWVGSTWVNEYQATYNYDANNFIHSKTNKSWNSSGTKVMDGDSTNYYFHSDAGINDLAAQPQNISVYPNPANGLFTLVINHELTNADLSLWNINGAQVMGISNLTGSTFEFDISNQANGMYFIQIIEAGSISRIKMMKK